MQSLAWARAVFEPRRARWPAGAPAKTRSALRPTLGAAMVIAEPLVRVGGSGGDELGLQAHFYAPPWPMLAGTNADERPSKKHSEDRQEPFSWWRDWLGEGYAKRAPIRAYPGYVKGLARYVQHTDDARGGSDTGVSMQGELPLDRPVGEALDLIREYRVKDHKNDTHSSPADCAVLWFGNEDQARPCGCDDKRLCSLCGPKEADRLAKDACDFLYGEFLEAALPKLEGELETMGSAWEIPLHKRLSAALERLMTDDPERYGKEVNQISGEMFDVIQLAYPEGRITGYQSLQLYGESNPGEAHFHSHNVVAPVLMVGDVWEDLRDDEGKLADRRPGSFKFKPLPGFIERNALEMMRFDWGRRQINLANRLKVPLVELGVDSTIWDIKWSSWGCLGGSWVVVGKRGKPILEGDLHLQYFGFSTRGRDGKRFPEYKVDRLRFKAEKRAKGYLGYQSRWPGQDLVKGLKGDGSRYTWTGRVGSDPKPETYGEGASFTGIYTKGAMPIYERNLSPEDVRRAISRLDKWPAKFPRLRWRGFLSTGNVKGVMEGLSYRQEKVEPEEDAKVAGELLRPVAAWGQFKDRVEGKGSGGRVFKVEGGEREVIVSWAGLKLGPVGFNGKSLIKGRTKCWVPMVRDGPG